MPDEIAFVGNDSRPLPEVLTHFDIGERYD